MRSTLHFIAICLVLFVTFHLSLASLTNITQSTTYCRDSAFDICVLVFSFTSSTQSSFSVSITAPDWLSAISSVYSSSNGSCLVSNSILTLSPTVSSSTATKATMTCTFTLNPNSFALPYDISGSNINGVLTLPALSFYRSIIEFAPSTTSCSDATASTGCTGLLNIATAALPVQIQTTSQLTLNSSQSSSCSNIDLTLDSSRLPQTLIDLGVNSSTTSNIYTYIVSSPSSSTSSTSSSSTASISCAITATKSPLSPYFYVFPASYDGTGNETDAIAVSRSIIYSTVQIQYAPDCYLNMTNTCTMLYAFDPSIANVENIRVASDYFVDAMSPIITCPSYITDPSSLATDILSSPTLFGSFLPVYEAYVALGMTVRCQAWRVPSFTTQQTLTFTFSSPTFSAVLEKTALIPIVFTIAAFPTWYADCYSYLVPTCSIVWSTFYVGPTVVLDMKQIPFSGRLESYEALTYASKVEYVPTGWSLNEIWFDGALPPLRQGILSFVKGVNQQYDASSVIVQVTDETGKSWGNGVTSFYNNGIPVPALNSTSAYSAVPISIVPLTNCADEESLYCTINIISPYQYCTFGDCLRSFDMYAVDQQLTTSLINFPTTSSATGLIITEDPVTFVELVENDNTTRFIWRVTIPTNISQNSGYVVLPDEEAVIQITFPIAFGTDSASGTSEVVIPRYQQTTLDTPYTIPIASRVVYAPSIYITTTDACQNETLGQCELVITRRNTTVQSAYLLYSMADVNAAAFGTTANDPAVYLVNTDLDLTDAQETNSLLKSAGWTTGELWFLQWDDEDDSDPQLSTTVYIRKRVANLDSQFAASIYAPISQEGNYNDSDAYDIALNGSGVVEAGNNYGAVATANLTVDDFTWSQIISLTHTLGSELSFWRDFWPEFDSNFADPTQETAVLSYTVNSQLPVFIPSLYTMQHVFPPAAYISSISGAACANTNANFEVKLLNMDQTEWTSSDGTDVERIISWRVLNSYAERIDQSVPIVCSITCNKKLGTTVYPSQTFLPRLVYGTVIDTTSDQSILAATPSSVYINSVDTVSYSFRITFPSVSHFFITVAADADCSYQNTALSNTVCTAIITTYGRPDSLTANFSSYGTGSFELPLLRPGIYPMYSAPNTNYSNMFQQPTGSELIGYLHTIPTDLSLDQSADSWWVLGEGQDLHVSGVHIIIFPEYQNTTVVSYVLIEALSTAVVPVGILSYLPLYRNGDLTTLSVLPLPFRMTGSILETYTNSSVSNNSSQPIRITYEFLQAVKQIDIPIDFGITLGSVGLPCYALANGTANGPYATATEYAATEETDELQIVGWVTAVQTKTLQSQSSLTSFTVGSQYTSVAASSYVTTTRVSLLPNSTTASEAVAYEYLIGTACYWYFYPTALHPGSTAAVNNTVSPPNVGTLTLTAGPVYYGSLVSNSQIVVNTTTLQSSAAAVVFTPASTFTVIIVCVFTALFTWM